MALTHNGTVVLIADVPSGYTRPTITKFSDYELKYENREISIAKSGVENATASTTFTNIVSAINTAIENLLNADIDTTGLTVTSYANLKIISTNAILGSVLYTNGAVNYLCTVDIFVKTA